MGLTVGRLWSQKKKDVKDINGSSSSTIPNYGSTAEEEARRTSTEKFERFLQAGKKCMVHLANNSCESPAGEHLRIEGDLIFEITNLLFIEGLVFIAHDMLSLVFKLFEPAMLKEMT